MNDFVQELNQRLHALREQGLYRELRRLDSPQSPRIEFNGKTLLNFSSNDYLGLANDPWLKEAAIKAVERYGAGAGASRLICGSLASHHELEQILAAFKGTEAALTFSSGYAAATGAICALLGKEDVIVTDKLVHACLVDAARLCGAQLRIFAHNDLNNLEEVLKRADHESRRSRILIVTESVFSMDGDFAPLRKIVGLKEKYGAWLMLDEAHANGIHGPKGRGLAGEFGVSDRIEIQMGTLGKALGSAGGFICGSRALIDYLINRARSFIFSTAPVPAAAAAATAAIRFVQSDNGAQRRNVLWQRVSELPSTLNPSAAAESNATAPERSEGGQPATLRSAIIPLMIGDEAQAVETAAALRAQGIFIPAIRYPTVARGQARLRLTLTAAHTSEDIATFLTALRITQAHA